MKNSVLFLLLGLFLFSINVAAQIRVLEAERSDTTQYTQTVNQDSVFIVYKGENNKSTISLVADFNEIDSLVFDWYRFNTLNKQFIPLISYDTVKNCTIFYDNLNADMNQYEGSYRVNIHNQQKGIDTTFTVWVWYQDFFINSITVYNSTCKTLELIADTSFQDTLVYYDLSTSGMNPLKLSNKTTLIWMSDPGEERKTGVRPSFLAPFEETTYTLTAIDKYLYTRERSLNIDDTKNDLRGYPYMRAVKPEFSGIHGLETADNLRSNDTAINVEAPHGVWFFNEAKNAEQYEWIFFNHPDWITNSEDSILQQTNGFEPIDSIFYLRPAKYYNSVVGYDVKLSVWGPIYNSAGDRCTDTLRKINFVIVDTTQFPATYSELPNVFTPNGDGNNDTFYYMNSSDGADKPVKSIQNFSIKIYNRWGNRVYEYEDNDGSWIDSGQLGWDGTTDSGTKANPGVYFYTIMATGWDNRTFKVGGYVHIFY